MSLLNGQNVVDNAIAARGPSQALDSVVNEPAGYDPEKQTYEVTATAASSMDSDDFPEPTPEEQSTLRKVAGNLPIVSYSLCLVEFAERASYFGGNGAGAPPRGTQETAGGLGMGLQASSGLVLLFAFLAYILPILGGWWADVHVGRYKAICVGVLICGIAHLIQIFGAIPSVLQKGTAHSAPPFIISLLILALGAGIFKPNIAPTILDQHRSKKAYTKVLKSGEKVIVDPELTSNRTMLIFYGVVNIGAFYMLATTYAENATKCLGHGGHPVATEVFFYFPIYNINDGGIGSVASNQGASMTTNGAPNDLLNNFNALTIIVMTPVLSHIFYPLLLRYNIKFGRINRITFGFVLAMISGVIGAIVQWRVYKTSPCGYYASSCDAGVSPILIWWQLPNVILGALSELFCNVTAYELAYARAPPSMRGLVMAIFLFTTALSSALGEVLIPVTQDPYLIWIWGAPAVALAIQTILFWFRFRSLNYDEFMIEEKDYTNITLTTESKREAKEFTPGLDRSSAHIHARRTVDILVAPVVVEVDIAVAAIGLAEVACRGSSRCHRWVVGRDDGVYEPRDIYQR
ncbi:hypothetical protein BDV38DRAFT_273085 [Aspergillus pseudotamarii]|uniref:POT family-domain-containing protein n=1 Tax=Aspergillus pseudotamarii TaxID=132259 RepID=A0A5N6SMV2_ASPPS|nr:uncharacterized protein BDV38DRAFT_273085 [Aspergillus pseudotamarii]KAE8135041.1 hypothetical protein BDV38DRAFT_273085 [Aspergillus pseudotamarii]